MAWKNGSCPVCRNPAREVQALNFDLEEFCCDECGRFRISRSAKGEMHQQQDFEARRAALLAAERDAGGGKIPLITSYGW